MKNILLATLLGCSLGAFANSDSDRCQVNINFVDGVEEQGNLKFVNSSAGPIVYMPVVEIKNLFTNALNEKGYKVTSDNSSSDYELKFLYFNKEGSKFGGVYLRLNGPGISVGLRQTPGVFDLMFSSQKKQVVNTTKSAISELGDYIFPCYL